MRQRDTHVLLVPGFTGGNRFFMPFRDELRARGLKADAWRSSPFVYRHRIEIYGRRLARDILALGSDEITLVGWSMGGLVSVEAMRDPHAADRVKRVIAYASPFDGTWAATLGGLLDPVTQLNVREMTAGSQKLASIVEMVHGLRDWDFRAVNGTRDWLAPGPLESLDPQHCLTGDFDHRSLLWDMRLFDLIHSLIVEP